MPGSPARRTSTSERPRCPTTLPSPRNANDKTFLTSFWVAGGPPPAPLDQTSRFITRFNPVPVNRGTTTIPLLVTVPNATANAAGGGCTKPAAGWPVAIVQHGLGGDRTNAFFMADQFADACFIVAGFDLPMHGITNTASPLYQAGQRAHVQRRPAEQHDRCLHAGRQDRRLGRALHHDAAVEPAHRPRPAAPGPGGRLGGCEVAGQPRHHRRRRGGRGPDAGALRRAVARRHRRRGAGQVRARHPHGHGRPRRVA